MRLDRLPLVRRVVDAGPADPVFDGLLLLGPFVVLAVVALGRSPVTLALAAGYLAVFVAHVLHSWLRR